MTAISLKQEGDDLYKQAKFQEAIVKYTSSIDRCTNPSASDVHLAYSNRCACYMHLNQNDKALEDANVCVALKPSWVKGYSRKASCLEALSRIPEAIHCYEKIMQLDRSNTEATTAISRLSRSSNGQNTQTRSTDLNMGSSSTQNSTFGNIGQFDWRTLWTSTLDRCTFYYYQCMSWWQSLAPTTKLYIQCGILVLFLYYMFFRPSYGSSYSYDGGYSSGYGYGGGGYGGYGGYGGGYGGGMSWTMWGMIMLAAYKVPPLLPDLLGDYARPFFGMNWTTFVWLLNMFSRNTGRMGGYGGGYGGFGGMPGGMFGGPRRRYY